MKDSIALIGFMATGKTTVGRKLINYLGNDYKLIEMDEMIIEDAGKSIPEIFSEDGEIRFREYEIAACKKASSYKKHRRPFLSGHPRWSSPHRFWCNSQENSE